MLTNFIQRRLRRGKLAQFITTSIILSLAALLRFHRLSAQSLWADEGNSVALARRGFGEIARRTAFDIHPPLYYWLLKMWIALFGESEIGLRSLSVALGLILVYLIGLLGARLLTPRVGLVAAFIAACSPLQVYYAQEARMYMLLALLSGLTVLIAWLIFEGYTLKNADTSNPPESTPNLKWFSLFYILIVAAGLYTHYAYPLTLIVVNLTALILFWQDQLPLANRLSPIVHWLLLQLIPLLLYLPWLPIAWRQITTWPSERQAAGLFDVLRTVSTSLLFGLSWPFELGWLTTVGLGIVLVSALWIAFRSKTRSFQSQPPAHLLPFTFYGLPFILICLWLLLPVILTIIIFSPAFLKFLLVASAPLTLLIALVIERLGSQRSRFTLPAPGNLIPYLTGAALLSLITGPSLFSLYHYYYNPTYARDNYRGIVEFIKAVGGPEDAIILNAEGQQDVFNYYYQRRPTLAAPVYPLPRQRPLDEAATLNELASLARNSEQVYAVYWASQQADPGQLIEGWLDTHLFKATDQWYGHVRLVSYAAAGDKRLEMIPANYQLGQHIRLTSFALSGDRVRPGDILRVVLTWQTETPLTEDYTLFIQIVDQANHLVGQRDAPLLTPAPAWPIGAPVVETRGLFVEPGTPPGRQRLIVGLYNSQTGQRLQVASGNDNQIVDFVELTELEVVQPARPLPLEAFNIQTRLDVGMLELTLLGYDLYKLGNRSNPAASLHPGDPLQVVAYWRVDQPIQQLGDQLLLQLFRYDDGPATLSVTRPLAGIDYPVSSWPVGQIVRAQYSFLLNDLTPGRYRLAFTVNGENPQQKFEAFSKPFKVE